METHWTAPTSLVLVSIHMLHFSSILSKKQTCLDAASCAVTLGTRYALSTGQTQGKAQEPPSHAPSIGPAPSSIPCLVLDNIYKNCLGDYKNQKRHCKDVLKTKHWHPSICSYGVNTHHSRRWQRAERTWGDFGEVWGALGVTFKSPLSIAWVLYEISLQLKQEMVLSLQRQSTVHFSFIRS
jgi:hypothetical protein